MENKKENIDNNIVDELINELKEPIKELNNMQLTQLNFLRDEVNYIINNNIKEERRVLKTFDMLLDLVYWFGEDIEDVYLKLMKYYRKIDLDAANDYERFYNEIINEEE